MRRKSHVRCGAGEKAAIISKPYLSLFIPQISENLTKSGPVEIPKTCPVCGAPTELRIDPESGCETLYCTGTKCVATETTKISHFCERDAMNIVGISEKTIGVLFNEGILHSIKDIYSLEKYRETIVQMDGFGTKKFENMVEAINNSKNVEPYRFLYAIGIPGFGVSNCESLCSKIHVESILDFVEIGMEDLEDIEGIGEKMKSSYLEYFKNKHNIEQLCELVKYIKLVHHQKEDNDNKYDGLTFVITGSLEKLSRKELTEVIKKHGGKVSGSVSVKTTALINNDVNSTSSKNKDAKACGVRIMSEQEFYDEYKPV